MRSSRQLAAWWRDAPADPYRTLMLAGAAQVLVFAAAAVGSWEPWGGGPRWLKEPARWAFAAGQLAAFAAGYRAVRALPPWGRPVRLIVALAVPLAAAAVCFRPFHSTDLYTYINRGWQQAEYGANPYSVMVYELPDGLTDPMFYPQWLFNPCPYGFVFALEAWGISAAAGRDYALTVALHKGAAVLTFGLLGAVVWAGLRAFRPAAAGVGLYLYACSPLLHTHHVGHAHNDLQMALGVAAAVVAAATGRWPLAFPLLAAGALVKVPAALAAPVLAAYMVRRYGWAKTALSGGLAVGLAGATALPYLDGLLNKRTGVAGNDTAVGLHNSLAAMAHFPVEVAASVSPRLKAVQADTKAAVRAAAWVAFGGAYVVVLWRQVRGPAGGTDLVRGTALVLTAVMLFSPKFHVWYVGWLIPLAVWLPPADRLRRVILAIAVAGVLGVTGVYQAHFVNGLVMLAVPLWWATRRPAAPAAAPLGEPVVVRRAA